MASHLDPSDPKHQHALERLESEKIGWLTSVRHDGQPQTSPVWFLWEDGTLLVYSIPTSPKVSNIRQNSRVSLHLNDDGTGGDIVTIEGMAEAEGVPQGTGHHPSYVTKYEAMVRAMGSDPERFAAAYSTAIRIAPSRFRVA